jgi:hypothetical protein
MRDVKGRVSIYPAGRPAYQDTYHVRDWNLSGKVDRTFLRLLNSGGDSHTLFQFLETMRECLFCNLRP